jgi:hypothetical protein
MRGDLRRGLVVGAIALVTALLMVGGALGGTLSSGDDQLVDVSKQLSGLQKKLDELQSKGRSARQGKLAAAADCGFGAPSQVFGAWGDEADYSLIPEGDLSSTDGWSLKNVAVTPDSNPFTGGSGSLLFTKGDSEAVTPVMCVNLEHPTLRMFLADRGGNGKAHLEVKVLYEGLDGHAHDLTVARLKVGDELQPSVIVPIGVNMLSVASANGWTPVALELKVHGLQKGETFSVAGIYVDPCQSR